MEIKGQTTREALYERIWSTPMNKLVVEYGIKPAQLKHVLNLAAIPTPPPRYWTKKDLGKPVERTALPPRPDGCPHLLSLEPRALAELMKNAVPKSLAIRTRPRAVSKQPITPPKTPIDRPPIVRATEPTMLTRLELYEAVWSTPMSRLAESYGISGNGLAKICARYKIPYPSRGYWAKHAVGKAPRKTPLSKRDQNTGSIRIKPTLPPPTAADVPPEVRAIFAAARDKAQKRIVHERLGKAHPVIAKWMADYGDKTRKARDYRDPYLRRLYMPNEWTDVDRRKHRFLDALFKELEEQGGVIQEGDRLELIAQMLGEPIRFRVREKLTQRRIPLTTDQKRMGTYSRDWRMRTVLSGHLTLEIQTFLPQGFVQQWVEKESEVLEDRLPEIVATFVAAGPVLRQKRLQREEEERQRREAERLRYEEQQRRRRDRNRWRAFREMAVDWQELAVVRSFLERLKKYQTDRSLEIAGQSLAEWISWAEQWSLRADPTAGGVKGVFERIAAVTEDTYRD